MSDRAGRGILLLGVSAVVLVAVVAGFLALGTPRDERRRRFDEVRVADLMAIRSAVFDHYERTGRLPGGLTDVSPRGRGPGPVDPATREPYDYKVDDDSTFMLCATFDYPTDPAPGRPALDPWFHDGGFDCYVFKIGRVKQREFDPVRESEPATGP